MVSAGFEDKIFDLGLSLGGLISFNTRLTGWSLQNDRLNQPVCGEYSCELGTSIDKLLRLLYVFMRAGTLSLASWLH